MSYPLIVLTRAPYSSSLPRSALDLVMAFAVFNQGPRVLFQGDGVLQLRADQQPQGQPVLRKVIDSLPLYDVAHCYALTADLERRGLSPTSLPDFVQPLDAQQARSLLGDAAALLTL
jgi:tRNA 2-thiouridine synthesizing protein C